MDLKKRIQKMSLRAHYRGHIFDFLVPPVNLSVLPVGLANFSVVGALGQLAELSKSVLISALAQFL